ncbi:RTX toxin activating protein [Vibrio cholerae]|nr:RTX toxin activating protein [Vibrio cholerae]
MITLFCCQCGTGERLQQIYIPEMIAPFGHGREVVNDLRRRVFLPWQGQKVCTVRGKVDAQNDRCIRKVQWFSI